jgi:hypothetical protein
METDRSGGPNFLFIVQYDVSTPPYAVVLLNNKLQSFTKEGRVWLALSAKTMLSTQNRPVLPPG